ncbi:MAG TPA: hypothetical protein VGG79_13550 [Roseiarcus sp.]
MRAMTGSGGRLQFGMVAGIKSERRPTSNRNHWPDCVGIRKLLIERDVAQMKKAAGSDALAAAIGQNPAAALAELQGAIANFGATVTGPLVQAAGPIMHNLAKAIEDASAALNTFNKAHPTPAPVAEGLGGAALAGGVGWGIWKGITRFLGAIGRGLGGGAGAAAAEG